MKNKISSKEAAECVYDSNDADWLESDDDLLGNDHEGDVDSFLMPIREDPLEEAQAETMEEEYASNSTNTMVGDIDEGDQLLPHLQSSLYVPTPVLQPETTFTYGGIFKEEVGPDSSLDATQVSYVQFCHKTKWLPFPNVSNSRPCFNFL